MMKIRNAYKILNGKPRMVEATFGGIGVDGMIIGKCVVKK
jgi:hypothetical protein